MTNVHALHTDREALLKIAGVLEAGNEHPLAEAILLKVRKKSFPFQKTEGFLSITGKGVQAKIKDSVLCGRRRADARHGIDWEIQPLMEKLAEKERLRQDFCRRIQGARCNGDNVVKPSHRQ